MHQRLLFTLLLTGCYASLEPPMQSAPQHDAVVAAPVDTGTAAAKGPAPVAIRPAPTRGRARPAQPKPSPRPAAPAEKTVSTADLRDPFEDAPKRTMKMNFGGSTYLSNDDSMSLASAQRMLWALDKGHRLSPGQIRPHELLNYFSFETDAPDPGDTFAITASAEQHGDKLALALAIQGSTPPPQPLDLIVVVDRSGSMDAEGRMEYTQRALTQLSAQLRPGDTVGIVAFANRAETVLANHTVGSSDPGALQRAIARIQPGGGTNLDAGLQRAWTMADALPSRRGRNQRVMLFTDAQVNQGRVDANTLSEIGRRFDADGLRLTGVGVGSDFNDEVLDKLTEKGKGAYVYLGSEAVVDRFFTDGFPALVNTIAHDVRFQLHLPDSLAMKKFYGEESSTKKADVQTTNYFAGNSQVFLQDLAIADSGLKLGDPVSIDVTWRDPRTGEPEARRFDITVGQALEASSYNVRKARALTAFADVLSTEAMGADCTEPMGRFNQWMTQLDDPEMRYVQGLLSGRCRVHGSDTVFNVAALPGVVSLELSSDERVWRSRHAVINGRATVDAPHGKYTVRMKGADNRKTTVRIAGRGLLCGDTDGRLACR